MNKYQWQQDIIEGLPKGQLHIISCSRQTGKSYFAQMQMQMQVQGRTLRFTDSYTEWKETWTWPWDRKVSVYGKRIWGKINSRYCKLSINRDGSRPTQYATNKEVFKKIIKDGRDW